jgi:acetoacetyl-CoA synthetase
LLSEAKILWTPSEERKKKANITRFISYLEKEKEDYNTLWKWSVDSLEEFWEEVWKYFNVHSTESYRNILSARKMPGAKWFEGSMLNYAEHFFLKQRDGEAVVYHDELGERRILTWNQLRKHVFSLANSMKQIGIKKGDRVAGYLANIPETIICMLASAGIGAIWSCCSADFGVQSVLDRFKQIRPSILFYSKEYSYGGRKIEIEKNAQKIAKDLGIEEKTYRIGEGSFGKSFEELLDFKDSLEFEHLPFESPLWILYSSGTTGLPKPIVHSHGGILIEHLKVLSFHNDIHEGDVFFWYTSTGWMMWNYLVSGLILGSKIVLYDGSPFFPDDYTLWNIAEREGITFFGTSAPYIHTCKKKCLSPNDSFELKRLQGIGSTGSPLSEEGFEWVYSNVKDDIWLASVSGGTDVCTGFVGGCPILPVYSGEIQCRHLGVKVEAFDEQGRSVIDEVGELVVTEPMPSMPVCFWNDDGTRYWESYFSYFPGVWRHGDWIKINSRGGCIIYGRSDSTIKRMGARIGTAEIYRAVESVEEVVDSLAVDIQDEEGNPRMVLFAVLKDRLDSRIEESIKNAIKEKISPRFVPDLIIQIDEIPKTLNGKKLEIPVKKILLGIDIEKAVNLGSVSNPKILERISLIAKEGIFKSTKKISSGA